MRLGEAWGGLGRVQVKAKGEDFGDEEIWLGSEHGMSGGMGMSIIGMGPTGLGRSGALPMGDGPGAGTRRGSQQGTGLRRTQAG